MLKIDDQLDQEEIDTAELEQLAAELSSAVLELDAIEQEVTKLLESVQ